MSISCIYRPLEYAPLVPPPPPYVLCTTCIPTPHAIDTISHFDLCQFSQRYTETQNIYNVCTLVNIRMDCKDNILAVNPVCRTNSVLYCICDANVIPSLSSFPFHLIWTFCAVCSYHIEVFISSCMTLVRSPYAINQFNKMWTHFFPSVRKRRRKKTTTKKQFSFDWHGIYQITPVCCLLLSSGG